MVTITIDDVIVVAKEPVSFTFVGDPKLNPLSPKKAFFRYADSKCRPRSTCTIMPTR
jgi:hypothetical protein